MSFDLLFGLKFPHFENYQSLDTIWYFPMAVVVFKAQASQRSGSANSSDILKCLSTSQLAVITVKHRLYLIGYVVQVSEDYLQRRKP